MNPRAFSVVFSVLLVTTLVHEIRAKGSPNSIFGPYRNKRNVESNNFPPSCKLTCDNSIPKVENDLQFPSLLAFAEVDLLGVARLKHGIGLVIDLRAQIFGVILGVSGEAVLVNIGNSTGYYLPEGSFGKVTCFEEIFYSFQQGLGIPFPRSEAFEVLTAPDNALGLINKVLPFLVEGIEDQCEADRVTGINFLIDFVNDLIVGLTGKLQGLPKLIGKTVINMPVDLGGFITFTQGLGSLIGTVGGNLLSLTEKGVVIDVNVLLSSKNGLESLTDIIEAIGDKIDWTKGIGPLLNNPVRLFELIAQLGLPYSPYKMIANCVAYIHGKIGLEALLFTLIQCLTMPNTHPVAYDVSASLLVSLKRFLSALERLKATQPLSQCIFLLRSLMDETLEIDGVNISSIVKLLRPLKPGVILKVPVVLELVVKIMFNLRPIVDISVSVPKLVVVLLVGSKSPFGVHLFKRMGMLPKDFFMPANMMENDRNFIFFKPLNEVMSYYMGDLYGFLGSLPGFGNLFSLLMSVIPKVAGVDMRALLNSGLSRDLFKACFQECGGHDLGAKPDLILIIRQIRDICRSSKIHYTILPPKC